MEQYEPRLMNYECQAFDSQPRVHIQNVDWQSLRDIRSTSRTTYPRSRHSCRTFSTLNLLSRDARHVTNCSLLRGPRSTDQLVRRRSKAMSAGRLPRPALKRLVRGEWAGTRSHVGLAAAQAIDVRRTNQLRSAHGLHEAPRTSASLRSASIPMGGGRFRSPADRIRGTVWLAE